MDEVWIPIVRAAMTPVYGPQLENLNEVRPLAQIGESFLDKDLRTLLDQEVEDPFELQYCGEGDLDACQAALWAAIDEVATRLAAERGPDPSTWLATAARTEFEPGLIPETIRRTNRPTYQQVLELIRD
jgi:hypothetical protein